MLPSENKLVQYTVTEAVDTFVPVLARLFDLVLTSDTANQQPIVYDLEVTDTHNYITDSVVVSNSSPAPKLNSNLGKNGPKIRP
jgi:hypothetical protein